jgi:hypothetical protein
VELEKNGNQATSLTQGLFIPQKFLQKITVADYSIFVVIW